MRLSEDGSVYPVREPCRPWKDRRVVLGVCGGVSAYKVVQVARDLTLYGAVVDVVLTEAARNFVTSLAFEGVTGRRPVSDPFSSRGAAVHVRLAREADCVCVAPATADFLARAAAGMAGDLPSAVLLAADAPVVLAPAMNSRMFAHPQTQANVAHLTGTLGYRAMGPAEGPLGVGEGEGTGRMAEPRSIVEAVGRALSQGSALQGKQVLVTAGPTREPVDPVRYVGARSSGRMGYAVVAAARRRGADATLVAGPCEIAPPDGVEVVAVETAEEMRDAVLDRVGGADLAVYAAAVSDYRPASPAADKIKRESTGKELDLRLVANPDIAAQAVPLAKPGALSVGFALETSNLVERARRKMTEKGFDLIVANLAGREGSGFGSAANEAVVLSRGGPRVELELMSKAALADEVLNLAEEAMIRRGGPAEGDAD